jgi:CheY-like chemotaxis protein
VSAASGGLTSAIRKTNHMDAQKEVLLVDDDPDDLEMYEQLFETIDPNVTTISCLDPIKALSYLQTSERLPALTILDFNMPKMNGLDFLRRVRADGRIGDLNVEVVSTGCGPNESRELLELGAECHKKAAHVDEIEKLLKRLWLRYN